MTNRFEIVTEKIEKSKTGLKGALYVHVAYSKNGRIEDINLSHKWKESGPLDLALTEIGESITGIVKEIQGSDEHPIKTD